MLFFPLPQVDSAAACSTRPGLHVERVPLPAMRAARFHVMRTTILAASLVFLLPALALAQSTENQTIEEIRKNATVHVGPFYLTPVLQLKELGIDTNVFNEAGEAESDFMFNFGPKVDLWVPMARRALLTTSFGGDMVWYAKHEAERSINPQITARVDVFMHRLTLFAENAFVNTQQRANYEIDIRARYVDNAFAAGAAYQFTPKFSVEVAGRRSLIDYDAKEVFLGTPLQQTLDRSTTGFSATARHKLTPLTTLLLRTEKSETEFEFSPQRNSNSLAVLPGVEFKPRALISGRASVGFRRFKAEDSTALQDFSGLVADLGLSYTLLGATTFGVSINRDLSYSFEELQPYYVRTSVGASVRRAIGRKFDAIVSADRHLYAYRDLLVGLPAAGSAIADDRADTTWNYTGSLGYRMNRTTRVGFGVSYAQRESTTLASRDYDGLRIGTTVTYGF